MLSGHGSASRRRRNSRAARIAVPLAIPMALGLTLGIVLAVSGGGNATTIEQSALGSCASAAANSSTSTTAPDADDATTSAPAPAASGVAPAASGVAPAASGVAPAASASAVAPAASATAPAAAPSAAAASAAPAPRPSGSASAPAAQAAAADNTNCDIIVPARPLSARGLATPYQLTGPNGTSAADSGCTMANAGALGAFVQATILNPRTGALSVYNPLVITQGTTPAVTPVMPKLPRGAIVTIDFEFNGANLVQVGATPDALSQGHSVNGF